MPSEVAGDVMWPRRHRRGVWCVVAALVAVAACSATEHPVAAPAGSTPFGSAPVGPPATRPATTTTVAYDPTTTTPSPGLGSSGASACPASWPGPAAPVGEPTPESSPDPSPDAPPEPEVPPTPEAALTAFLADGRLGGGTVSVSVWVDGYGEVVAHNPDVALVPASNQKLVTAIGALALLGPTSRLRTELIRTGPIVDGVLRGDLVLVAGGDPTLLHAGAPHSLDALAETVRSAGIERVEGRLVVDASRYDDAASGVDWPPRWLESNGPLSALVVNRNRHQLDAGFLADPALANAEVVRAALALRGIAISGDTTHGRADLGIALGALESPTIDELVQLMLLRSDNLVAELLVKEIAHRATGTSGTTADGLTAIRALFAGLCLGLGGTDADGSGLSYANRRSAREHVAILRAARQQPWGANLWADLAVAGQLGAFAGRLDGPVTAGRVRAKSGSLAVSRALSGYLTTRTGRTATFSILVNGGRVGSAEEPIDEFVTALVQVLP